MQTILPPSGNTIKILGKPKLAEHGLRWMTYVLAQPVEGGVLVFHTLLGRCFCSRRKSIPHRMWLLNCAAAGFAYRRRWTT